MDIMVNMRVNLIVNMAMMVKHGESDREHHGHVMVNDGW